MVTFENISTSLFLGGGERRGMSKSVSLLRNFKNSKIYSKNVDISKR